MKRGEAAGLVAGMICSSRAVRLVLGEPGAPNVGMATKSRAAPVIILVFIYVRM